jgi:cell wall-active antibiotic response 4TMS protein YvqF
MTDSTNPPQPEHGVGWRPPRERETNVASIVVGLVLLAIGIWYLLDQTLGLDMPRIRWSDVWPIILIVLGGVMLYRSATRRT